MFIKLGLADRMKNLPVVHACGRVPGDAAVDRRALPERLDGPPGLIGLRRVRRHRHGHRAGVLRHRPGRRVVLAQEPGGDATQLAADKLLVLCGGCRRCTRAADAAEEVLHLRRLLHHALFSYTIMGQKIDEPPIVGDK